MASGYVCGIPTSPTLIEISTDNAECTTNQSHQKILQTPKNVELRRVTLEVQNCKTLMDKMQSEERRRNKQAKLTKFCDSWLYPILQKNTACLVCGKHIHEHITGLTAEDNEVSVTPAPNITSQLQFWIFVFLLNPLFIHTHYKNIRI
jgi:hypothetical protein